jgi:CRISPR/Cas system-associated exonuclease Cas4 (RecB family)
MLKGISCPKGKVLFKDCLECPVRCVPPFVIDIFVTNQVNYFREHAQFSVSQITNCLRRTVLQLTKDYFASINGVIAAVNGILVHRSLSDYFKTKQGYLSEYKMEKRYGLNILTGTLDLYSHKTKTIYDFKTSSSVKPWYKKQLSIYKQMLDLPVEKLAIVFVGKTFKTVYVDEELVNINERLEILSTSLEKGALPEPEPSELCSYCEVKEFCSPKITVAVRSEGPSQEK